LLVAALHVGIVASLGGKLLYDRTHYPRVWTRVHPVDPQEPFRGRYVQLRAEVGASGFDPSDETSAPQFLKLAVEHDSLVVLPSSRAHGIELQSDWQNADTTADGRPALIRRRPLTLADPLAFFIPERVADPSIRKADEELWVEVTVPPNGRPRPIRLGTRSGGKSITPLKLESP
jgi:GDYXXLXY protein